MKIETKVKLHNRFDIQVIDAATGKVRQIAKAENLVTDAYYNTLDHTGGWRPIDTLLIGTGTGTPAATDTALFNQIYSGGIATPQDFHYISDTEFYCTTTQTLTENQAIGNLTEIGLYAANGLYSSSYLFSHAMFTDGEGNPIIIEKTDADRLIVTVTIYLRFKFDSSVVPLPFLYRWLSVYETKHSDSLSVNGQDDSSCPVIAPVILRYLLFSLGNKNDLFSEGLSNSYQSRVARFTLARGCPPAYDFGFSGANSQPITTTPITHRFTANRILSDQRNIPGLTYQIFGFYTPVGYLPLPNHTKFPPLNLELSQVASANQQDFNFGIAELMPEVTVFVNDVRQSSNDYVWGGKDFTLKQAWANAHGDKLVDHSELTYANNSGMLATPLAGFALLRCYGGTLTFLTYDFGSAKAVNTLRSSVACTLEKSDDGETWTTVATKSGSADETITFTETSARYWKVSGSGLNSMYANATTETTVKQFIANFDKVTPQLHFNNPLSEGDVVRIQCKSEFPIKNSNWLIDQFIVDWQLGKDTSV